MKRLLLLAMTMLLLGACSAPDGDRYVFQGGAENWKVNYTVDVHGGTNEDSKAEAWYTGKGETPKSIDYTVSSALGNFKGTNHNLEGNRVSLGKKTCSGCAVIQGSEEIEVNIMWNGEQETIFLSTGS